jgi:hypothetical protein
VKIIRESLRAKRKLHRNTTELFNGRLRVAQITPSGKDAVAVEFVHEASANFGSRYTLTLSRADLTALVQGLPQ